MTNANTISHGRASTLEEAKSVYCRSSIME
jgi:hypothetical protein